MNQCQPTNYVSVLRVTFIHSISYMCAHKKHNTDLIGVYFCFPPGFFHVLMKLDCVSFFCLGANVSASSNF